MADLFISYAREDQTRVRDLVSALEEQGWSIFWDRRIPAGKTWQSYISRALSDAKGVIVAWSHHSITSDWVIEEANDGKKRGLLIPVLLDSVEPPLGFRGIQAADLTAWRPGQSSRCFDQLIQDIAGVVGGDPPRPSPEEELAERPQPVPIPREDPTEPPPQEPARPKPESSKPRLQKAEVIKPKSPPARSNEHDGERAMLLRAAEDGDTSAMLSLGQMYALGRGVKQDLGAAVGWYRTAAEAGDPTGMNETGGRLAAGLGVNRDRQEAFRWFLRAAEAGSASGMTSVGLAYRRGVGVDRSDSEAVRWLQKAAETGYADAMAELGAMYADGAGVAQDDAAAVQWFRKAAGSGAINGVRYLAIMHEQGRGVPKDDRLAHRLLRKAADAGDAPAMVLLGRKYLLRDQLEARRLFEEAANAGDPEGMRELANLYARGIGGPEDAEAATGLLEKAAANDDVESMRRLGMDHEERGRSVEAILWYRRAAVFRDEFSVERLKKLAGADSPFELVHTFVHTHEKRGPERSRIADIAWSADGRFAAFCANYAGETPSLWDAREWKELRRIQTRKPVERTAFSPRGPELGLYYHYFVKGKYGGSVGVFDLANDRLILDCDTTGWYCTRLWFQGENLVVLESEPQSNNFLNEVSRHSGALNQLFSGRGVLGVTPDTMLIAIRSEDGSFIEIREGKTGKTQTTLRDPEGLSFTDRGAFSDDGKQFAAEDEEAVRIWDLSSGKPVIVIPEKGELLFSPNGRLLAIAPGDSMLRLWDTETGQLRQTIAEEDFVEAFAFRPDGKLLLTAHHGGRIRVWAAR